MLMEKQIYDILKSHGFNDYAASGIMGNLYAESELKSNNLQNTYEKSLGLSDIEYTKKVNDGSYKNFIYDKAGYGLAQWTYWSRKKNLLEYAKKQNKSIDDLEMQLEFLLIEMKSYTKMMDILNNASSIFEASNAVLLEFEKPANQSIEVQKKRASYGQIYYDKYASKNVSTKSDNDTFSQYVVRVKDDELNIRSGPGINYDIKGVITDHGSYTIVEEKNNGNVKWGKLKSGIGWISLLDKYVEKK